MNGQPPSRELGGPKALQRYLSTPPCLLHSCINTNVDTAHMRVCMLHVLLFQRRVRRPLVCYLAKLMDLQQGWHHTVFYSWIFHSFFKKLNHLRSNKIRFYSVLLQMSWHYGIEGPMFANGGVDSQVPSVGTKPWFYLQKSSVFALKPKPNASTRKSWVFSTLDLQPSCHNGPHVCKEWTY